MQSHHDLLKNAIQLAYFAHYQQSDKAGRPYILHPLRVMQNVKSLDAKVVAVLHDILEDTQVSSIDLHHAGLHSKHLYALLALSKHAHESRFDVLKRTLLNPLACEVKCADVLDNMNLLRLKSIQMKDLKRYRQYQLIYQHLMTVHAFYQRLQNHQPLKYSKDVKVQTKRTILSLAIYLAIHAQS
jgi:(p)ppGpp synthase/HD superfamily hydrolase